MNCPICNHPMHHHRFDEITLNECGRCGGIWFDAGQLDQLKEITDPDLRWLDIDFWKSLTEFEVTHHPLKCPHCQRVYLTKIREKHTDTSVLTCNQCHGIWVERNQLIKIIAELSLQVEKMDSADYIRETLHQFTEMLTSSTVDPKEKMQDIRTVLRLLKYRIYAEHPKLLNMILGAQKVLPI